MNHTTISTDRLAALERAAETLRELRRAYDRMPRPGAHALPPDMRDEFNNARHRLADIDGAK